MLHYPAILDLASKKLYPLKGSESFLVGRNETADVCVLDPTCSRHHFRIVRRNGQHYVEPLQPTNPTLRNGQPMKGIELVEHGDFLQAGQAPFQFLLRQPGQATSTAANRAPAASAARTVMGQLPSTADELPEVAAFPVSGVMVIGREPERVRIPLPHPHVSRTHACISVVGTSTTLTDLKSANGTFVNGRRITSATLRQGDLIDIGPYALQFTGTALIPRSRTDNVELVARNVTRIVKDRETGKRLALLDDITLVVRPREFVCLLGPSGSGKSTLLKALSGRERADGGAVLLNGKDLFANFEALKQDIAVVPQKDVLHESLAVGQALWYTAKLRLPPDTSRTEIEAALSGMLETVGLTPRRATSIRHLSGGQVKRASLANEILCKPSLLFLDEVTSGLDEQTDAEVMNLFRTLADAGKTVLCITHSLTNVDRTCHLVVILTAGGKLAFVGKPAEALEYFGIDRLGDVYDCLRQQPAEHWRQKFLSSPLWQRYVLERLPPEARTGAAAASSSAGRARGRLRLLWRQTVLLTSRYGAIWRGDYLSLLAMAGQALLVAILLGMLFGNLDDVKNNAPEYTRRSLNLMFLMAVSSFWFGCNNAAKEIVKERTIFARERDFNVRVESYYASKLLLLAVISGLQTVLLFAVARTWCDPPGAAASQLMVLLALAFAGVALGLAISAFAATEEMAITLIPMAVIPQIILSGAISPLAGWTRRLALMCISTYWGKRGLDACLPDWMLAGSDKNSTTTAVVVLLVHATVGVTVALAALYWQNLRGWGLADVAGRVVPWRRSK